MFLNSKKCMNNETIIYYFLTSLFFSYWRHCTTREHPFPPCAWLAHFFANHISNMADASNAGVLSALVFDFIQKKDKTLATVFQKKYNAVSDDFATPFRAVLP